ncbi:tellurium resistance protein TerC [Betaproteobacteria bacterium]|nr:tellurium resistance protein TerC [Betaproteobacteria bacterium]GHU16064.1 tellurium resistance protein TerC [Betaproteobacteria bacterium]
MAHFGFPLEAIVIFFAVVGLSVYLDLVAHKNAREITASNAAAWTVFWVALALCFYVYVWLRFSKGWADLYLAGYVLEKSLSVDNLMVFIAIFASFGIKSHLQHRILYWGILGALVFRAIFVLIGTSLFLASPWVGFIFAAFVAWSAIQMLKGDDDEEEIEDYSNHWSVRLTGRLIPVYTRLHLDRFFVKHRELFLHGLDNDEKAVTRSGALYVTPAFLCLMVIETSDIAFSFDSVPAVISVTQEPLLVYAAMIFAILGLRSLYFVIAALTRYLVHLEKAVIALLFFIAAKMALQSWNHVFGDTGFDISPGQSLAVVLGMLLIGVIASFVFPEKEDENAKEEGT